MDVEGEDALPAHTREIVMAVAAAMAHQNEATRAATEAINRREHLAAEREKAEAKRHRAVKELPLYEDGSDLDAYLNCFEAHLDNAGVPRERWARALSRVVPARMANFLIQDLPLETQEFFQEARQALMLSEGYTLDYYLKNLFRLGIAKGLKSQMLAKATSALKILTLGCTGKEDT